MTFQIIRMCGGKKKSCIDFIPVHTEHGLYSLADEFNIQLYNIRYIKQLPVTVHVTVKLHHKRILRIDPFEILFGISYEKLIKQAIVLVSGIYLQ